MRKIIILLCFILPSWHITAQCPTLLWSDEFDGESLDQSKWSYQTGDGCDIQLCGWGNNELQSYRSDNIRVLDGNAIITAKREQDGTSNYTSARIRTINKGEVKYGRIEASIKLPKGQGIWPAFWMLPTDNVYGDWPLSGEIDIMEYRGQEEDVVHGTIHFGQAWPNNQSSTKTFTLSEGKFSEGFNVFAIEWTNQSIKWFVNGYHYSTKTRSDLNGQRWPFDQDFHLLLNMAVGGNFSGNPDGSTSFPQQMEIDYVRVYDMTDQEFISGPQTVAYKAQAVFYRISNLKSGADVEWIVPESAEIVQGQGTNVIEVNWESRGGKILARITDECGSKEQNVSVRVEGPVESEAVLENFDLEARITRTSNTGNFIDNVPNPMPNDINSSELCAEYKRNGNELFDVIFYDIQDINNGNDFITGKKKFYIDVLTDASVGSKILFQLEDNSLTTPDNYPRGRHSRYEVAITKQNEWHRLEIPFLDRPDSGVAHGSLDQLVILFEPNTNNNSTYYFDNLEIYSETNTTTSTIDEIDYEFSVTPNPVQENLFFNVDKRHSIEAIYLYDYNSKLVKYLKGLNSSDYQLDLSELKSGIYFINVKMSDNTQIVKTIFKS